MPISILTPERELDVGPRCAQRRDGQEKNGGARKRVIREKHFINASSKGKGGVLLERPPGKTALIRKRGADSLGKGTAGGRNSSYVGGARKGFGRFRLGVPKPRGRSGSRDVACWCLAT